MRKPITFDQARAAYPHRYTCDHIPEWAREPMQSPIYGPVYYAPQYASDLEWYEFTEFPKPGKCLPGFRTGDCASSNQSWPIGRGFLKQPYRRGVLCVDFPVA